MLIGEPEPSALLRTVARYGIPSVIAMFLVWFLTGQLSGQVSALTTAVQTHAGATDREIRELRFYLRSICFNTATTETQRASCIPDGGNYR